MHDSVTLTSYKSVIILRLNFLSGFNSVGEQVIAMRDSVKQLPQAHFNCLKYMIEHLNKVASHQTINKMTEHNLATVFAPTLIAIPRHLTDLSQEIFMLTSLITHCQAVFMN